VTVPEFFSLVEDKEKRAEKTMTPAFVFTTPMVKAVVYLMMIFGQRQDVVEPNVEVLLNTRTGRICVESRPTCWRSDKPGLLRRAYMIPGDA